VKLAVLVSAALASLGLTTAARAATVSATPMQGFTDLYWQAEYAGEAAARSDLTLAPIAASARQLRFHDRRQDIDAGSGCTRVDARTADCPDNFVRVVTGGRRDLVRDLLPDVPHHNSYQWLYVNTGGGHDRIVGGDSPEDLHGGAGDDVISGGGGDDVIDGGPGHDRLRCGAGHDFVAFRHDTEFLPPSCEEFEHATGLPFGQLTTQPRFESARRISFTTLCPPDYSGDEEEFSTAACSGTVRLTRAGRPHVLLAKGAFRIAAQHEDRESGETVSPSDIHARLTRAGRRLARRHRGVRAAVRIRVAWHTYEYGPDHARVPWIIRLRRGTSTDG
jgi:hypothetical protein